MNGCRSRPGLRRGALVVLAVTFSGACVLSASGIQPGGPFDATLVLLAGFLAFGIVSFRLARWWFRRSERRLPL